MAEGNGGKDFSAIILALGGRVSGALRLAGNSSEAQQKAGRWRLNAPMREAGCFAEGADIR